MKFDSVPISWFDFLLVVVLLVGLARGRRRGMSAELTALAQWITIVIGCALIYEPVGQMIATSTPFSLLFATVVSYLGIALIVKLAFIGINRQVGGKLIGSDIFGGAEYYLGMISGMIRFFCVLMMGLALLNAKLITQAEAYALARAQQDSFGSISFPTLGTIQQEVFEKSISGKLVKNHLAFLLIKPTKSEEKKLQRRELAY